MALATESKLRGHYGLAEIGNDVEYECMNELVGS